MFLRIKNSILAFGAIGTDGIKEASEKRRVQITNYINLASVFSCLGYIIMDMLEGFYQLLPIIITLPLFIVVYFISTYQISKKRYSLGKFITCFIINANMVIPTIFFVGKYIDLRLYLFILAMMPLIIWDFKRYFMITFFILLSFLSFLYIHFVDRGQYIMISPEYTHLNGVLLTSILGSFILICIFILILQVLLKVSENELIAANEELNHQNREITELLNEFELNRDELVEINKTKDKFLSIIATDLKNPFYSILGLSEMMIKDYDTTSTEDLKKYLEALNKSTTNTFKLLENLLDWARTQKGNMPFNPELISIPQLLNAKLETLNQYAKEKQISINYHFPEKLYAKVDSNMISSIFRNLISNAINFSNRNSEINIYAKLIGNEIEFTVKDNGIGIPENQVKKLFRIDVSPTKTQNNESGTGLGLILCKEFVERHNGRIWAECEEGMGCEFKFIIPAK